MVRSHPLPIAEMHKRTQHEKPWQHSSNSRNARGKSRSRSSCHYKCFIPRCRQEFWFRFLVSINDDLVLLSAPEPTSLRYMKSVRARPRLDDSDMLVASSQRAWNTFKTLLETRPLATRARQLLTVSVNCGLGRCIPTRQCCGLST
jgi:hypothetical protein